MVVLAYTIISHKNSFDNVVFLVNVSYLIREEKFKEDTRSDSNPVKLST